MEVKEKQIGKFIIFSKELGKGAYAVCKKGCFSENENQLVAVKIIDKNKLQMQGDKEKINRELEHIKREINHLKVLDSDHIVKIFDIAQTPNNLYLFLEYCNGGSLDAYLQKNNNQLSEQEALLIFGEICKAFKSMQKNKIIHRDIKPQNILIHNSKIKLADFGFSKMVQDNNEAVMQTFLGTPLYLPIEILMGEKYSSKCDVFSLGIILYEMLYGIHPFFHQLQVSGIPSLTMKLKLSTLKFPDSPKINPYVKNLLEKMLAIYEVNRISWDEIFIDPYFIQIEDQENQQKNMIQNENDNFKKIMIQQDKYLNENLVCGLITKLDKKIEQVDNNQSNSESQKQDQYQEEVSLMHQQILFERNVAIFYFNLLRKLWRVQKKIQNVVSESLFYRVIYSLSKMGLLFLTKLSQYLNNQIENLQKTQDQTILNQFKNTIQFKQDLKLLQNDQNTYMKLQFELCQKTQDLINRQIENEPQNQEIKDFLQIFKENIDKKTLKSIFDLQCKKILDLYINNLLDQDQETLTIIKCLQIVRSPYQEFVYKKNEGFNFHKFYDNLEKKDKQILVDEIQIC